MIETQVRAAAALRCRRRTACGASCGLHGPLSPFLCVSIMPLWGSGTIRCSTAGGWARWPAKTRRHRRLAAASRACGQLALRTSPLASHRGKHTSCRRRLIFLQPRSHRRHSISEGLQAVRRQPRCPGGAARDAVPGVPHGRYMQASRRRPPGWPALCPAPPPQAPCWPGPRAAPPRRRSVRRCRWGTRRAPPRGTAHAAAGSGGEVGGRGRERCTRRCRRALQGARMAAGARGPAPLPASIPGRRTVPEALSAAAAKGASEAWREARLGTGTPPAPALGSPVVPAAPAPLWRCGSCACSCSPAAVARRSSSASRAGSVRSAAAMGTRRASTWRRQARASATWLQCGWGGGGGPVSQSGLAPRRRFHQQCRAQSRRALLVPRESRWPNPPALLQQAPGVGRRVAAAAGEACPQLHAAPQRPLECM